MTKRASAPKKKAVVSRKKSLRSGRTQAELSHSIRIPKIDIGFGPTESGRLFAPVSRSSPPVQPSRIKSGIRSARRQIEESLEELLEIFTGPYRISQIELEISFSADGKFLGFGVGGATSMKVVIAPDE